MNAFLTNPWTITIFGGLAATILAVIFLGNKKDSSKSSNSNNVSTIINNNINTASNAVPTTTDSLENTGQRSDASKSIYHKNTAKILFIDDSPLKDKIQNLIRGGWKNVKQIKDLDDADSAEVREADIIFVDYKGIGGDDPDQGLAVLNALRNRYGNSKWLILFTAYDVPVNAFGKGANDYLVKNSSKYEVEQKIQKGLQNLNK